MPPLLPARVGSVEFSRALESMREAPGIRVSEGFLRSVNFPPSDGFGVKGEGLKVKGHGRSKVGSLFRQPLKMIDLARKDSPHVPIILLPLLDAAKLFFGQLSPAAIGGADPSSSPQRDSLKILLAGSGDDKSGALRFDEQSMLDLYFSYLRREPDLPEGPLFYLRRFVTERPGIFNSSNVNVLLSFSHICGVPSLLIALARRRPSFKDEIVSSLVADVKTYQIAIALIDHVIENPEEAPKILPSVIAAVPRNRMLSLAVTNRFSYNAALVDLLDISNLPLLVRSFRNLSPYGDDALAFIRRERPEFEEDIDRLGAISDQGLDVLIYRGEFERWLEGHNTDEVKIGGVKSLLSAVLQPEVGALREDVFVNGWLLVRRDPVIARALDIYMAPQLATLEDLHAFDVELRDRKSKPGKVLLTLVLLEVSRLPAQTAVRRLATEINWAETERFLKDAMLGWGDVEDLNADECRSALVEAIADADPKKIYDLVVRLIELEGASAEKELLSHDSIHVRNAVRNARAVVGGR